MKELNDPDNRNVSMFFSDHSRYDETMAMPVGLRSKRESFRLHQRYKGSLSDPLLHMCFPGHFVIYKSDDVKKVGGYKNVQPAQDFDLHIRISHLDPEINFAYVPGSLYKYRNNTSSVTSDKLSKIITGDRNVLLTVLNEIGYDISDIEYFGRMRLTNFRFYDIITDGSPVDVPWLDREACNIVSETPDRDVEEDTCA